MIDRAALVLVVDDHATMRKVVKSNLQQMGFPNVIEANDGADALSKLAENTVGFIVCDWNMPRLSGFDLLTHIRKEPRYQDLPFMMVTAEADRDSVEAAVAAGVDEFLIKPFTPATLREKVKRIGKRGRHVPVGELQAAPVPGAASVAEQAKPDEKASILIVDDTPTNIDVISGLLSKEYRVLAATNGKKGLALAKRDPAPDLILLDIMMPEMDGMEVCQHLQEDPDTSNIPIIFLTAKTEVDDIAAGLEAGAVDYVTKPANPKVLRARVKTHLGLKRARDELNSQLDTMIENARLREDVERMTRHDLKNPLSAILNTSEHLLESKYLGAEQKEQLETVRKASYDMLGMINRSLDLYKMEMGTYEFNAEPIDIAAVCHKVVEESRANARESDVTIRYEAPDTCLIQGEELLCFSMLGNLLRNAVEASPPNGKVLVEIGGDDEPKISIHNMGAIPDEIKDTLFEKYVTAGKQGGTGIGTYSAKLMATTQGGSIAVESSENAGTTFTVTMKPATL